MSTLSVTTITTGDDVTPLSFTTGNASSGFIKVQAANDEILFSGTPRFSKNLTANNIYVTGTVGIGITPDSASDLTVYSSTRAPTISVIGDGQAPVARVTRYSTDANAPQFQQYKYRGTRASPSAVVSGDVLGQNIFAGYDGTGVENGGYLRFRVDGTVSTGIVPGRMEIATTNSTGSLIERFRLDSSGNVGIGTTAPTAKLDISSTTANNIVRDLRITRFGSISFHAGLNALSYNSIVQVGDKALIYTDGSQNTGSFVIAPWDGGSASGLRLTSNGWVGIGTSSPSYTLDINGRVNASSVLVNDTPLGMTLLGSVTPSGIAWANVSTGSLAGYKALQCVFNGISHNSGSNQSIRANAVAGLQLSGTAGSGSNFSGLIIVDLLTGIAVSSLGTTSGGTVTSYMAVTPFKTATDTVRFAISGGSFDAGTIYVYGLD